MSRFFIFKIEKYKKFWGRYRKREKCGLYLKMRNMKPAPSHNLHALLTL